MFEIIDKILLLICTLTVYYFTLDTVYVIIPILFSVCISCFCIYLEKPVWKLLLYGIYLSVSFFHPSYMIFLPLIMYDLLFTDYQFALFGCFLIFGLQFDSYHPIILTFTFLFCGVCYYLKYKTEKYLILKKEYYVMRDTTAEFSLVQEEKNRSILENQDYEINVATLNERNRISKEIHDNIGHLLSRSLLQIGALLTISKDDIMKEGLTHLKDSISEGMDNIRASIHNIHDESVNLYNALSTLIKEFTLCPITFEYDISNAPILKIKYCFIAVTKECLSNIVKHSNASLVSICLKEEPSMYQLIISDNGKVSDITKGILRRCNLNHEYTEGMGLQNIVDRVKGFQGNINITADDGFKIFISIPKET